MEENVVLKRELLLVLALILPLSAAAQPACEDLCRVPETKTDSIIVDASSRTQLIRRFPQATGVEFIIVNKNPFKYEYRTEIVGRPLSDAIAFDFITKVAGVNISGALLGAGASACQNVQVQALETTIDGAEGIVRQMETDLKSRADAAAKVATFLSDTDKDKIDCLTICKRAREIRGDIDKVTADAAPLEKQLATLQTEIGKADAQFAAAGPSVTAMAAGPPKVDCETAVTNAKKAIDKLKEAVPVLTKSIQDLKDAQASAKRLGTIIDNLKSTSFNEVQRRDVGETSYDFSLFRRDLRKKDAEEEKIAAITADVGTSPISISGGIGFTTIEDVTIVAQTAVDPADSTKTISVFAEENASSFKPTPVVMLNANLSGPYNWGRARMQFSWSLGVALATRNDTTQTEYLTGPSFGFLDNRVLFTFAYHAARVAKLGGGFRVGQQIPAPLLQNLPVVNKWDNGFMFAVSYRIR